MLILKFLAVYIVSCLCPQPPTSDPFNGFIDQFINQYPSDCVREFLKEIKSKIFPAVDQKQQLSILFTLAFIWKDKIVQDTFSNQENLSLLVSLLVVFCKEDLTFVVQDILCCFFTLFHSLYRIENGPVFLTTGVSNDHSNPTIIDLNTCKTPITYKGIFLDYETFRKFKLRAEYKKYIVKGIVHYSNGIYKRDPRLTISSPDVAFVYLSRENTNPPLK